MAPLVRAVAKLYDRDVVMSSLFGMYAKCGMFRVAVKVFDEMPERYMGCRNTVISCYLHDGMYMVMDIERGKEVHDEAVRNRPSPYVRFHRECILTKDKGVVALDGLLVMIAPWLANGSGDSEFEYLKKQMVSSDVTEIRNYHHPLKDIKSAKKVQGGNGDVFSSI
ncbi:pentatricopeptide repeat-containing protein [Tanacetum coccineum]